jgi:hypothetical protein
MIITALLFKETRKARFTTALFSNRRRLSQPGMTKKGRKQNA